MSGPFNIDKFLGEDPTQQTKRSSSNGVQTMVSKENSLASLVIFYDLDKLIVIFDYSQNFMPTKTSKDPLLSINILVTTSADADSFVVGENSGGNAVFFTYTESAITQESSKNICASPKIFKPTRYSDYYIGLCNNANPRQLVAFSRTKAKVDILSGEFQGLGITIIYNSKMIALYGGPAGTFVDRTAYVYAFPEYFGCSENCNTCSTINASAGCTKCNPGYLLNGGVCEKHLKLSESKKFRLEQKLLDNIDFDIKLRVDPQNPNANSYKYPEDFFKVEVVVDSTGGTGKETKASTLKDIDGNISIYILLKNYKAGDYELKVTATDPSVGLEGSESVKAEKFDLDSQKAEAKRSGDTASIASKTTSYFVIGTTVFSTLLDTTFQNLAADSSLIKFTMLVKLINRLRFVNVHHGLALDAFFGKMEDVSSPFVGVNFDRILKNHRLARGKYTRHKIELEMLRAIPHILFLYSLSFLIGIFAKILLRKIRSQKKGASW